VTGADSGFNREDPLVCFERPHIIHEAHETFKAREGTPKFRLLIFYGIRRWLNSYTMNYTVQKSLKAAFLEEFFMSEFLISATPRANLVKRWLF